MTTELEALCPDDATIYDLQVLAQMRILFTDLLVGKDQEHCLPQLVLGKHAHQLVSGFTDSLSIIGIDHEYETLRVLKVMTPQGPGKATRDYFELVYVSAGKKVTIFLPDFVLTADIPHGEADVLVLHGLHIKACGLKKRACV